MNRKVLLYLVLIAAAAGAPYVLGPKPGTQAAAPSTVSTAHAQAAASTATAQPKAAAPVASLGTAPVGRIESDELRVSVTSVNGGFLSAQLKSPRFARDGVPIDLVTTDKPAYLPFGVELEGLTDDGTPYAIEQASDKAVRLTKTLEGVEIVRKVEAGGPYQVWLTTRLSNHGAAPRKVRLSLAAHHYVSRENEGGGTFLLPVQSPNVASGLCRHSGELEREHRDALAAPLTFSGEIQFTGIASVFYLSALAPEHTQDVEQCSIQAEDRGRDAEGEPLGTLFSSRLVHKSVELKAGESRVWKTLAYVGPKMPDELLVAGHGLKEAIESGWFASLADGLTWLLRKIHDLVGNWGIAIILLTFLVKTALFPLTAKQMQSMAKMKELKPEMDRINELYADDREKKGAAVMELYRKRGVNPMAGCFPVLLQLPIWFSLYASLSSNVELLHAPFFLWWKDLSSPDPYFVLPLLLGVLMFVQQKMSPATAMDPMQQKMMLYMMPIMMTSFMLFLPAGLCLYTLTNSALSIGQQRLIEARLARVGSSQPVSEVVATESAEVDDDDEPSSTSERLRLNRPSKAERRANRGKR
jgi:YidC/Oxa1 family membrane protein insertase